MISKEKLKKWLKTNGFEPANSANGIQKTRWSDCMSDGAVFRKNNRLYRFRTNQHEFANVAPGWTVDVSVTIEKFDRWANSQVSHALNAELWMRKIESRIVLNK